MSEKLTDGDFAGKVEWEGGIVSSLEYGLRSKDLIDQTGALAATWRRLESAWLAIEPLIDEAYDAIEAAHEEED